MPFLSQRTTSGSYNSYYVKYPHPPKNKYATADLIFIVFWRCFPFSVHVLYWTLKTEYWTLSSILKNQKPQQECAFFFQFPNEFQLIPFFLSIIPKKTTPLFPNSIRKPQPFTQHLEPKTKKNKKREQR